MISSLATFSKISTICKEFNLLNYEEHLKNCEFKDIKDSLQIDNLVYFNTLPIKEDPYSNSILMEYSVKNAQDEIEINKQTSLIDTDEIIKKKYEDWDNPKLLGYHCPCCGAELRFNPYIV